MSGVVILVGMMGAGKSTVGPLVARHLACEFVDLDDDIAAHEGMSVPDLFATGGESAFRQAESEALARVLSGAGPKVVSVGGGAVLDPVNRALMSRATVVWLRARTDTLAGRVGSGDGRPLLAGESPASALDSITSERSPLYKGTSNLVVDVDYIGPEQVADAVVSAVRARREAGETE